jgi:lysozyme family protein
MADFNTAYAYTIEIEKRVFTNDPKDPGGPTKFGITLAVLASWNARNHLPTPTATDVENMSEELAIDIYRTDYWNALNLGQLYEQCVATAVFDMGVNDGPGTSARFLQQAAGFGPTAIDGKIGPTTIRFVNTIGRAILPHFIAYAQNHYVQKVVENPQLIRYLQGWMNRSQKLAALLV